MNFSSAGCLFSNEQFLLAGYQPRKQKPFLSGLGGKREGDESFFVTALRETIEELFEIQTVPFEWIEEIQTTVVHKGIVKNGDYISVLYSFQDLESILHLLKQRGVESELYEIFPTSLFELIFKRKLLEYPAEISHLTLLPLVLHSIETPFVSPYFIKDMRLLLQKKYIPTEEKNDSTS